ncbi:MAG: TrkH family potassium uptake protein [Chitinispirillaceae bacterium]|nr:TrkH family potassium uptake protein [Chitinispirillaceae bacterium]
MNIHFIKYSLGKLLQLLAFSMVIPGIIAAVEANHTSIAVTLHDVQVGGFCIAIVLSLLTGTVLTLLPRKDTGERTIREGFAIVTFGWLLLTLFGGIPLFIYFVKSSDRQGVLFLLRCFTDACFEVMSGFTTTGATILADIEKLPSGLLFWRSMTHWLGGMGIVTLGIAIFPAFGVAAYQLFRGEVPGPTAERFTPSLAQTAKILWGVYAALTLVETALLFAGGMSLLDAFCHAFGTMATGGFSTRNASIGAYKSAYIDWVTVLFMFFAGMNFIIHYNLIFFRKWNILAANHEFRFYGIVIITAIAVTTTVLMVQGLGGSGDITRSYRRTPLTQERFEQKTAAEEAKIASFGSTLRHATFQVVSIITTTGYCTADFDMWPGFTRLLLVVIMFFGGCAGSTGGGMKMVRIMVVIKSSLREVRSMIQPRRIIAVRIADKAIDEKQVHAIVGFFVMFLVCTAGFSLIMSLFIPDFTTAVSSVIATICNVGPGLSGIGATENYSWIPSPGKWMLILSMLLGRLELYTVLIAFAPASWRK